MYKKISIPELLFSVFTFLLMWMFFSGNYYNEDYDNYVYAFNKGLDRFEDIGIEPLFAYLCHWADQYGIRDYDTFKSIVAFVFMIPYWYILTSKSEKPAISILIYMPLFLIYVVILRNFMAWGLLSIGVLFLAKGGKKNYWIFLLALILAEGIHNLMFLYLLLLALPIDLKIFNKPIMFFALICLLGGLMGTFISETISNLDTTKYSAMAGPRAIRVLLGVPLLLNYLFLRYVKNNSYDSNDACVEMFENNILKMNFLMMSITCFFPINFSALRLANNLLLFDSVYLTNRLTRRKHIQKGLLLYSVIYVGGLWYYVCNYSLGIQFQEIFVFNHLINNIF